MEKFEENDFAHSIVLLPNRLDEMRYKLATVLTDTERVTLNINDIKGNGMRSDLWAKAKSLLNCSKFLKECKLSQFFVFTRHQNVVT